jgi:sugar O-acyltransferase (sialic acid O-acetyltransferase NeuD family)
MVRKKLLIIGAGGGGRETYTWARRYFESGEFCLWEPHGYLDKNSDALRGKNPTVPILGNPETWEPKPDEVFVCSIGNPEVRRSLCDGLTRRGADFVNVVDPTVIVEPLKEVGPGTVIYPNAMIGPDTMIGKHCYINMNAVIGHDAIIGAYSVLSPTVSVLGGASLGEGVFVGTAAVIFPGKKVGAGAVIGAGALVTKDVEPGVTVFGAPAKVTKRP